MTQHPKKEPCEWEEKWKKAAIRHFSQHTGEYPEIDDVIWVASDDVKDFITSLLTSTRQEEQAVCRGCTIQGEEFWKDESARIREEATALARREEREFIEETLLEVKNGEENNDFIAAETMHNRLTNRLADLSDKIK